MEPEIRCWMEYADADLGVARHLLKTYRPQPLEIICYHCQQAAEKAIKAVYIALAIPGGIPRKHDLTFLLNQLRGQLDITPSLRQYADSLNAFGVLVRYPAEIMIEEHDAVQSIFYAGEIIAWARQVLGSLNANTDV